MATGNDYFLTSEQLALNAYFDDQGRWLPRLAYEGTADGVATLDASAQVKQPPAGSVIDGLTAGNAQGANLLISEGGTVKKVTGGQPSGPVIYDSQGNVISSKGFKLNGAEVSKRGSNLFHEPNGEYDRLYWDIVSGSVSTDADSRLGGLHFFSTVSFEAATVGRIYNPSGDKNYWLLFEDLGTDRLEYRVELYDVNGTTLSGVLIDWTTAVAGLNVINLESAAAWPTSPPTGWASIRLIFRASSAGAYRFASVSLSYGEPYYPDRTHSNERFYQYRHGSLLTGSGYGTTTSLSAGSTVWLARNTFTVPVGWRLRVGLARYFFWDSNLRLHIYVNYGTTYSWTSSVNRWNGALNLTLVPTRSSQVEAQVNIGIKNIGGSAVTVYKEDSTAAWIQAVPL